MVGVSENGKRGPLLKRSGRRKPGISLNRAIRAVQRFLILIAASTAFLFYRYAAVSLRDESAGVLRQMEESDVSKANDLKVGNIENVKPAWERHRQQRARGENPMKTPKSAKEYVAHKWPKDAPSLFVKSRQPLFERKDKNGKVLMRRIKSFGKEDLKDHLQDDSGFNESMTFEEAAEGKQAILDILTDAGVENIDVQTVAHLPKSSEVERLYGEGPVIVGLERCEEFRRNTPPEFAHLGTAGLFNTGTNPFSTYTALNCKMPQSTGDPKRGMRWQVPWGKHTPESRKWTNTAKKSEFLNKNYTMPIVLVRDPFSWMHSMCRQPYSTRYFHGPRHCPALVPNPMERRLTGTDSMPATIMFKGDPKRYDSLVHMWSEWNREYLEADYPRLMIRFEDLQFHARKVLDAVCQCVGGVPATKDSSFVYIVDSAKVGSGHRAHQSNLITGMIKYGSDKGRYTNMTKADLKFASEHLDREMMDLFQYNMPPRQKK